MPEVTVVVTVAGHAIRWRAAAAAWGLAMAIRAVQLAVCAGEREVGLTLVVEFPDRPAIGRMADLALGSQTGVVHILCRMTAVAVGRCSSKRLCAMALRAADDCVQAQQRKLSQIVIEADAAAPALLAVTALATGRQLAAVRILRVMAGGAVGAQLLRGERRGVTDVTFQFGVRTEQLEFALGGVVEVDRMPLVVAMALAAVAAKAPGMRIVGPVAADTRGCKLGLVVGVAVTVGAVESCVPPEERKLGLPGVIETGAMPVLGGVALGAVRAARSLVYVVGRMAADATLRRVLVLATDVTGVAAQRLVRAGKHK